MPTLNLQVSQSSDDAWERNNGAVVLTDTAVLLDDRNEWAGVRFQNVTIAQGTTITSATLTLNIGGSGNVDITIYGDDVDDAPTFSTTTDDISGRTRTTASTTASETGYSGDLDIDVTSIIQEIINRAGWSSGNSIALPFDAGFSTGFSFTAYDGTPANAAALEIVTPGGGGSPAAHYYLQLIGQV